jgi:hypothetical protein
MVKKTKSKPKKCNCCKGKGKYTHTIDTFYCDECGKKLEEWGGVITDS